MKGAATRDCHELEGRRDRQATAGDDTDWQETGRELRDLFRARAGQRCGCYNCARYPYTKRGQRGSYWVGLFAWAPAGDPSALVKHLCSRRKLTQLDRSILADLLEALFTGELEPRRSRGRPKKTKARACVGVARKFYQDWKKINRRNGVRDWGHGDDMKDDACRLAIELYGHPASSQEGAVNFEEVRELMERPRARRQ